MLVQPTEKEQGNSTTKNCHQTPSSTTPVKREKKHINKGTWSPTEPRVYVLADPEPALVFGKCRSHHGRRTGEGRKEDLCLQVALRIEINGSRSVLNDE